jgi:predicted small lipoprotein YifL
VLRALGVATMIAAFSGLTACGHSGPADFAAATACNVRVEACSNQCLKAYEASGSADAYLTCEDRCRASQGPACP